jgi:Ca2+-binding EF-hand superfamily protein
MGCGASTAAGEPPNKPASEAAAAGAGDAAPVPVATSAELASGEAAYDPMIEKWGRSVFDQFDTDKDGGLSIKELTRALKSLPRKKPKNVPPGTKFQSVDEMIAALDADGNGSIEVDEWLEKLGSCAGLAAALAENVNEDGEVPTFRSFEQQKAKREGEVAALEAKESRTAEEEAELVEFKRQIESLQKKIEEAAANQLQLEKWGRSVFEQFDTDKDGKLSVKELTRALKSLPRKKPKNIPPGTKFMSVDEMIAAMDADGDGSIDVNEWLERLVSCAGLAAALAENVNEDGVIAAFRSFEQQKAKREGEVAALEAKESRTTEEEAELVEFKRQIESLQKKIGEAAANAEAAAAK